MRISKLILGLAALGMVVPPAAMLAPAAAQEVGQREVMLSPGRSQKSGRAQTGEYNPKIPAIGMIRTADFAIRSVTIEGDSRDKELREKEIRTMVENTIKAAEGRGIELSFGTMTIEALNLDNFAGYASSNVFGGSRPDTSRISFLIKVPLNENSTLEAVTKRLDDFQAAIRPVGRAQFSGNAPISLSIVKPDQYRAGIIDLLAADSRAIAARVGPEYAVSIDGLHQPVDWVRWGDLQILLFVPYEMTVLPKPAG